MKKLMIAAAIVCAAVVGQAAEASWKFSASNIYDGTGEKSDDTKYTGNAYVFHGTDQQAVFNTLLAGNDITGMSTYFDSLSVNAGAITATTLNYGEQGGPAQSWFFVLVEDDKAYFSNVKENIAAPTTSTAKTVGWGSQSSTAVTPKTYSNLAPTGTTFAGQGYWSTVPEPTSGLLLLLGVAGLALRRRRA